MPTSSGKATKRAARLARAYIAAAIPAVVILAPAIGNAERGPIRTTVCEVRTLTSPLLGECRSQQPAPQPEPTSAPSANPAPSQPSNTQPSSVPSSRAVASGSSAALPPPQAESPAPSTRGDATGDAQPQTAPSLDVVPPQPDGAAAPGTEGFPIEILDVVFAAALSGGLVWLIALRRRRRQQEAVERTMAHLGQMKDVMANYIHEILTPVTGIMLAAQLLAGRRLSMRERRDIVARLNDASIQLERTVDLLRTYAALREGSISPERAPFDPVATVQQCAASAATKKQSIKVHVASSMPDVRADAALVGAAVSQLMDNAIKFSPAGEPVDVFVRPDAAGSGIEIAVRDRGMGIDAGDAGRIFDEYTQLDGTSTREFGGVGLGLALVREIAHAHDGTVTVDSVPGAGSTFTLRLPAVAAKPVAIPMRSRVAAA